MSDLNFKEWLSDEQWAAVRQAVEAGTKAFADYHKLVKKKKPKIKKENRKPHPKQEDLHKWLLEKKKLPAFLMRIESSSQD